MLSGNFGYSLWTIGGWLAVLWLCLGFLLTFTKPRTAFSSRFSAVSARLLRFISARFTELFPLSSTVSTGSIITTTICINKITTSKGVS